MLICSFPFLPPWLEIFIKALWNIQTHTRSSASFYSRFPLNSAGCESEAMWAHSRLSWGVSVCLSEMLSEKKTCLRQTVDCRLSSPRWTAEITGISRLIAPCANQLWDLLLSDLKVTDPHKTPELRAVAHSETGPDHTENMRLTHGVFTLLVSINFINFMNQQHADVICGEQTCNSSDPSNWSLINEVQWEDDSVRQFCWMLADKNLRWN